MNLKHTFLAIAVVGLLAFATANSANAQGHHGYSSHGHAFQPAYSGGHGYSNGHAFTNGRAFSNGHGYYSGYGNVGHGYAGNVFRNRGFGGHGYNGHGFGGHGQNFYSTPTYGYSGGHGGYGHGGGISLQTHNFGLRIGH